MASTTTDRRFGVNSGRAVKVPCRAATTANITLSGEQTIDGLSLVSGERVLVKNQTSTSENGIYVVDTGAWSRSVDANDIYDLSQGTLVAVVSGTANSNTMWRISTSGTITPGSTGITFVQAVFSDSGSVNFLQSGSGAVSRTVQDKLKDIVHVKDFGAVGDYATDDTSAIDAAFTYASANGLKLDFGSGVYRYTGTLALPQGIAIRGDGAPRIATFPQTGGDKSKLRPGFKSTINGACIIFDGTGTTTSYTTNRSDRFASVTPMVTYLYNDPYSIEGIAFIQDMDVLTSGGALTTSANDNLAASYTAGMVDNSTISQTNNFVVFGYFDDGGYIIHNQTGGNIDPDYITHTNGLFSSGVHIIGHDTAAGAATEGLTGTRWVNCGIYAHDHHTRADGNFNVPALYIDGFITGSIGKIRGHTFDACNIRCYANDSMILDHADDIQFSCCTWEFSILAGVSGADATGGFVGTSNTGDVWVFGGAGTTQPKVTTFLGQTTGNWLFAGGGEFDDFMVGAGAAGVRIFGSSSDSVVQLTKDFSSINNDWTIRRDDSDSDSLEFRYDGASVCNMTTAGFLRPQKLYFSSTTLEISSGVVTITSSRHRVTAEGSPGADDLDTINGGTTNQILTLSSGNSSDSITVKDGTGNLRIAGDFLMDNVQDRIVLEYDGSNWCEISRSNNT